MLASDIVVFSINMFPNLYPFDVIATWDRSHGTRLVLIMDERYGRYIGFPLQESPDEHATSIPFRDDDWQTVFSPPTTGAVSFDEVVRVRPDFATRRVARLTGPVQDRLRHAYKSFKDHRA